MDHAKKLDQFFIASEDFANVFSSATLDDFRKLKDKKIENFVHMISYVSIFLMRAPF